MSYYTTAYETSETDNIHGHPYEDYYQYDATNWGEIVVTMEHTSI